jgi:hypothetical protein
MQPTDTDDVPMRRSGEEAEATRIDPAADDSDSVFGNAQGDQVGGDRLRHGDESRDVVEKPRGAMPVHPPAAEPAVDRLNERRLAVPRGVSLEERIQRVAVNVNDFNAVVAVYPRLHQRSAEMKCRD